MSTNRFNPFLGYGLGYRHKHTSQILAGQTEAQWFEAISENYMGIPGEGFGPSLSTLIKIREMFPVVLHSVSMSIGSSDPLPMKYLQRLKELADIVEPKWMSDHLCWTSFQGKNSHDLLPLPYDLPTAKFIADRISFIQDYLERPFLIENVSAYVKVETKESALTEIEFINEIVQQSGCGILLDLNNVFVTSYNTKTALTDFTDKILWDKVGQVHLAGPKHSQGESFDRMIDTHDSPVRDEVWGLLQKLAPKLQEVSLMIEWDDNIPELATVEAEMLKAKNIIQKAQV